MTSTNDTRICTSVDCERVLPHTIGSHAYRPATDYVRSTLPSSTLAGIGPEAPVETTPTGGQHSAMPYRFDLLDAKSIFAIAEILHYGTNVRKYPANNWRSISVGDNLNHVLMHIFAYMDGDTQDEHLKHALTRMMFAVGVELQGGPIDLTPKEGDLP